MKRSAALVLLGAMLALAGCTSSTTGASEPPRSQPQSTSSDNSPKPIDVPDVPTGKIGDGLTIQTDDDTHLTVTVSDLKVAKPSEFVTPTGVLYSVNVEEAVSQGSFDANPLYFSARSAAGDSYDADLGGVDPQLGVGASEITAGQSVHGLVAFDVPKGQTISIVIMADPLGTQLATWNV
jgi:hypothetical protein